MSFIYIIIVGIVLWFVIRLLTSISPTKKIEKYEEFADLMFNSYRTTNKVSYGREEDDPEVVYMHNWYVRLKEKYKHDQTKLVQIAEDWKDYAFNLSKKNTSFYLSLENDEDERHTNNARESSLRVEEIENRFATDLGKEFMEELHTIRRKRQEKSEAFWNQ